MLSFQDAAYRETHMFMQTHSYLYTHTQPRNAMVLLMVAACREKDLISKLVQSLRDMDNSSRLRVGHFAAIISWDSFPTSLCPILTCPGGEQCLGLAWGQKSLLTSSHMNSSVQNLDFELPLTILRADPVVREHTVPDANCSLPLMALGADPAVSTQHLMLAAPCP